MERGVRARGLRDVIGWRGANVTVLERGAVVAGKYKLEKPLGAGGMGSVWIAEQQPLGRNVAFKVLKKPSDAAEARFFREMQALARIQHPNVVTVYDSGRTEDGALYIAMELVDGPTLREELITRGRMTEENALAGVRQIAAGLAAAHERKIAHFDLKPDNVVLHRTTHGVDVKILDFGIARILEEPSGAVDATSKTKTAGVTEEGVAVGTPGYMSPEQLLGVRDDVRSDLYALGVIWFELLTQRALFVGATTAEVAAKTLTETPPRACDVVPGCASPATEAILATLLARDPNLRPKDAVELVHMLDRLSTSTSTPTMTGTIAQPSPPLASALPAVRPTATTAVPLGVPTAKRGSGHIVAIATAAVVVVGVAIGAVCVWHLRAHKHHGPTRIAVLNFDAENGDPTVARIVADTLAHSLAALPELRVVSPLVVAHALKVANGDSLLAAKDLEVDLAVTGTVRAGPPLHVSASLDDLDSGDAIVQTEAEGANAGAVVRDIVPRLSALAVARSRVERAQLSLEQPTSSATSAGATAVSSTRKTSAKNDPDDGRGTTFSSTPVLMVSSDEKAEREYLLGMASLPTDLSATEHHLSAAVKADPDAAVAWVHLALVRGALNGTFAAPGVRAALDGVRDPSLLPAPEKNAYYVGVWLTRGDPGRALEQAKWGNSNDPEDPLAWAVLGIASAANNDGAAALHCLEQSIDRAPDLGMTRMMYAHTLMVGGKADAAVKSLQLYLKTHDDDVDAQGMLRAMGAAPSTH
jgi:serine/threonine-protein kinase